MYYQLFSGGGYAISHADAPVKIESQGKIKSGEVTFDSSDFALLGSEEISEYIENTNQSVGYAVGVNSDTTGYSDGYSDGLANPSTQVDTSSVSYKEGVKQGKLNGKVTFANWSQDLANCWGEQYDGKAFEYTWMFNSSQVGKRANLSAAASFTDTTGGASGYGGSRTEISSIKLNGQTVPSTYSWVINDGDILVATARCYSGPNGAYGIFRVDCILTIVG